MEKYERVLRVVQHILQICIFKEFVSNCKCYYGLIHFYPHMVRKL